MEVNSGKRKAALLLLGLGKEATVKAFQNLRDTEIEDLSKELARLGDFTIDEQNAAVEDFFKLSRMNGYITSGGMSYTREVLEKCLGKDRAEEIMFSVKKSFEVTPFEFLKKTNPESIIRFIQEEQPQTVALILSYLSPDKAGKILSLLPEEMQPEVARRIALMSETPPDIVRQVEKVLEGKISTLLVQDFNNQGGVNALAEVINRVDKSTEKKILAYLEEVDPELAEEVKDLMFVFEDILNIEDQMLQKVLQNVDMKDFPIALKTASESLKKKIFNNLSDRAVQALQEEMEYMGPVRVKEVEEMQKKIVNIIRNLEEAGEIYVSRGGSEDEFV